MALSISPTQDDILNALGNFLTQILPGTVTIEQGQINRIAEPAATDFVVMWPINFKRLATNIDNYVDAVFTGSISGAVMNIAAVNPAYTGKIAVGSSIYGVNVASGTVVTSLGTGTGGVGTYNVSPSQTVASETLAAGTTSLLQKAECIVQIDVHGSPSSANASSNAQIISTAFRDAYAYSFFTGENAKIAPLYADDPRFMPFYDGESQTESRWIIEAHLQINQSVVVPQQFFDAANVLLIEIDAVYPPT